MFPDSVPSSEVEPDVWPDSVPDDPVPYSELEVPVVEPEV